MELSKKKRPTNRKIIEDYYQSSQIRFVAELKDRLLYLKEYFDSRYSPLKAKFEINIEQEIPHIEVRFSLVGEMSWSVNKTMFIGKIAIGQLQYQTDLVSRYMDEIRGSFEEEVRKEGIRSINTRFI